MSFSIMCTPSKDVCWLCVSPNTNSQTTYDGDPLILPWNIGFLSKFKFICFKICALANGLTEVEVCRKLANYCRFPPTIEFFNPENRNETCIWATALHYKEPYCSNLYILHKTIIFHFNISLYFTALYFYVLYSVILQ